MSSENEVVIQINNIGKTFLVAGNKQNHEVQKTKFSALKHINLNIVKGNVYGLIGSNGSGKSTLLKIIGNIIKPDEGFIKIKGKVAAILELGAGFHPDLSGMENIYFNATLLGYDTTTIKKNVKDIVDFSELGEFIYEPIKHYSSGMFMRLAFSIVAHLPSDILLLDEIFSVGDPEFRLKSINKIKQLSSNDTTIILVSHDLNQIKTLCSHCILLDKGEVDSEGEVDFVISDFVNKFLKISDKKDERKKSIWVTEDKRLPINMIEIIGLHNDFVFSTSQNIEFEIILSKVSDVKLFLNLVFLYGFDIPAIAFNPLYSLNDENLNTLVESGKYIFKANIPAFLFNSGSFMLDIYIVDENGIELQKVKHLALFHIISDWPVNFKSVVGKQFSGPFFSKIEWQGKFIRE